MNSGDSSVFPRSSDTRFQRIPLEELGVGRDCFQVGRIFSRSMSPVVSQIDARRALKGAPKGAFIGNTWKIIEIL